MPPSKEQRYAGVEDEFRVTTADECFVTIDELVSRSRRFFFNEAVHVPIFEPVHESDSVGGRIWTWYGGAFSHDYDSRGTLIEATTPLTPINKGIEALVDNVLTQRAQLIGLARGEDILGNSTHLNLLLDSFFEGTDLCEFKACIPSNSFAFVKAQKLGADVALIATHTISPVIAYLLFNHKPAKGALYRPRRNRRIELCLPYVPEPNQMRAGFLFWFAAVDYITDLIKADLREHKNWVERYQHPDYYKIILTKFPFIISDIKFKRPSYYLGYQIDSGQEENVRENGSKAMVNTEKGVLNIVDLAKAYTELFSEKLSSKATRKQIALLEDFLNGKRVLNVDKKGIPESLYLHPSYIEKNTGKTVRGYLNEHKMDKLASIHLKFFQSPFRVIKPYSRTSPQRIVRNLPKELDWDFINLELAEENENVVRRYLLEIPLHQVEQYLKIEESSAPSAFLNKIKRWVKSITEISNPRSLFAYGTLMNPERDSQSFGITVTSVQKGYAYGEAYDFGEYPLLIENYGASVVPGVVLSFSDFEQVTDKFDRYEGCYDPNPVFIRALRQVRLDNFEDTTSWIYIGNWNSSLVKEKLKTAPRVQGIWTKTTMRSRQVLSQKA